VNKRAFQLYSYLCIIAVYVACTFLTAPSPALLHVYHLSTLKYRLILATVAVPLVIIWLVAFYGFRKLQSYAATIAGNKEGKFVNQITWGLFYLAFQFPIVSALSSILNIIDANHPNALPTTTIISHYIRIVLPLVGFIYISYGARGLTESVKLRPSQRATHLLSLGLIIIGAGFTYFVFQGVPADKIVNAANQAKYYLPGWLVFFTFVVPNIFTWYIGLLAAYETYLFNRKVSGILYRRAWEFLAGGLAWIIFVSIIYQYLTLLSSHLTRLKINALLLIVYAALILLAVGYVLVAVGARRLQKIEEV
jgi:hypothetical protein